MKRYSPLSIQQLDLKQYLALFFAAGIALRISGLTTAAIWYDEAVTFEAAKLPFFSMVEATKFTFSPPLWGILVWVSIRVFGQNELGLRLPALFAGLFLLWITYQTISDFRLSNNQKIVAIAFISMLPYQLSMAQDGRMYTILSSLYFCALWFALRNRWLGLIGCSGLLLYTHYTAPFYLIAIYSITALNNLSNRKHILKTFASGCIALLSFLPWIEVYTATLSIKSPVPPLSASYLLTIFYRILFDDTLTRTSLLSLAFLAIIGSTILCIRQIYRLTNSVMVKLENNRPLFRIRNLIRYLQVSIFSLLPLIIMVSWSFIWNNFVYYRLLASMIVPMIIWVILTFASTPLISRLNYVVLSLWAILILAGVLHWSPQAKTGDLHDVANFVNEQWQDGDIIYHITGTSYLPFSQYLEKKPEYLIDVNQHDWLLPAQLQNIFGIKRKFLEDIPYHRAWIFYSRDELISYQANNLAQKYIKNATLIGVIKAWRFSPIEVYLLDIPISQ